MVVNVLDPHFEAIKAATPQWMLSTRKPSKCFHGNSCPFRQKSTCEVRHQCRVRRPDAKSVLIPSIDVQYIYLTSSTLNSRHSHPLTVAKSVLSKNVFISCHIKETYYCKFHAAAPRGKPISWSSRFTVHLVPLLQETVWKLRSLLLCVWAVISPDLWQGNRCFWLVLPNRSEITMQCFQFMLQWKISVASLVTGHYPAAILTAQSYCAQKFNGICNITKFSRCATWKESAAEYICQKTETTTYHRW